MAGRAKAVSDEYKSALVDLTFNSKPMINLLTMLAEENNEYAQTIVNVICDRIKHVATEQKMPALYLLDSILKNIGREYMVIISKNIVEVFCCVFEAAPDERKRMQLFKLRNTWNQYIPNKTLYELDVRVTRTDPNWPVAAPIVTSAPNVIHVNPKFLQKNDPTASPISATLAASIVAEKEASKLQSKINKQRLLEEEKRVQEQLRILQADKLKRDREQHELMLQQQQQERERLISEQKRQLEVLRKQQQNMSDPVAKTVTSTGAVEAKTVPSPSKAKINEVKVAEVNIPAQEENDVTVTVQAQSSAIPTTEDKPDKPDKPDKIETEKEIPDTSVVPPVIPHMLVKDPRVKNDVVPNDPRLNRKKGMANKSAVNVLNKIVTNLSKGKPDAVPQVTPVRKIRPYINPMYARSPVSIATARQSFASRSFNTLNLSVSSPTAESLHVNSAISTVPVCSAVPDCIVPICTGPVVTVPALTALSHNSVIHSSVASCVTSSIAHSHTSRNTNSNLIVVQCHNNVMSSSSVVAGASRPLSITKSQFQDTTTTKSVVSANESLPTTTPITSIDSRVSVIPAQSIVKSTTLSCVSPISKSVSKSCCAAESKSEPIISFSNVKSPTVTCSLKDGAAVKAEHEIKEIKKIKTSSGNQTAKTTVAIETPVSQLGLETTSLPPSSTNQQPSTPLLGDTSADVPPPFSGDFKSLSTRDMLIASQAAAIATAMHQMQSGPGSSGVMAPEQSAQLAAHLIEIMQGTASAVSTTATSTTTTTSTSDTTTVIKGSTDLEENNNNKKKQPKEDLTVTEINQSISRERSPHPTTSVSSVQSDGKNDSSMKNSTRSHEKVRERSPHASDSKRETRHSKQRSEGRDDEKLKTKQRSEGRDDEKLKSKQRSEGRDDEKLKSPERNLRSRTRERDKPQVILGDEPPSKRLKDTEQQERGRKARARSPSRYYNRMERKIVSEKRVEEKEKELVLQRFRKVSDGDSNEQSKADNEKVSGGKERTSPVTVKEKTEEEEELEIHEKEFNMLKERLFDVHKNKEKTGAIDQDVLTKIMVEIDHKAKDGKLSKDAKDDLMWQIRHIRAESKHITQKHGAAAPKGKKTYVEHQDQVAPNTHLHWRSRKDHSNDLPQGAPPERFGRLCGPRGPHERFDGPGFPAFEENPHIHESMAEIRNAHPCERFDEQRHGPPPEYMGDAPPHSHYQDGLQPHLQNRPSNMHDSQLPPHMRNNSHGSFMGERTPHHGSCPPYNANEHPQNMGAPMMDGPRPPHMLDGPRPPHMMEGQRPPHMDGPRPPHMMGEPRPPHMMEGPRPHHMMDEPRPPHMMEGPLPPHMMDGPHPPHHMMDGPRPPHMMEGPQPPHMMDGPQPPHMMDGPRPPHMMDGPRPPHMMDGTRPPHMMDGPHPPHHMMDGPQPLHMMDGPRPPHMMEGPRPSHGPQTHDGPQAHLNIPQPSHMPHPHMDGPHPPHMDGPRPHMDAPHPHHMDVPRPPHMDSSRPPHMDGLRPPHMDGPRPPHMMDGPQHMMKGPHPSHMLRPHHVIDGHQPPVMMDMSNPAYRMDGPPGHMPVGPQPPFMMEGMQAGHQQPQQPQQMDSAHSYHPPDVPHSQHSVLQHNNQGHSMLNQGHPAFHHVHGQSWTSSSNTFHPTIDAGSSSSVQHSFDVSSLLGQLSAAGLLPRVEEKTPNISEPEQPKQEVPEIKLILEDLKVRNDIVIGNLIVGKQCSSCGERFPSEVHSEHLDWHFRQNRKEKGGVRKDCRQWYFDLKDWVEQDTRKVFEDIKVQSVLPENEEENVEQTEEVLPSKIEEPQKLVSDDSIPVGEAGEVCHVCMDPLEQYWDEDREEWRYKKAVREQNRTYHYHCFADYVPFELEEEPTPPGTPLSPPLARIHSPHSIETKQNDTENEEQLDATNELEILDATNELEISNETLDRSTELNASTEMDVSTSMQFDTSTFSEVGPSLNRLTVSMMDVITPASTDGDLSMAVDTPTASPTDKLNNNTNKLDTENDVMSTIQDILRAASFNIKTKNIKDIIADTKIVDAEVSKNIIQVNENELELRQEISALLSDMVDIVTKRLVVRESKTVLMLPFVSSIMGSSDEINGQKDTMSIDTESITMGKKVNENLVLTECSKTIEPIIGNKELNTDNDNKKELDEEQDIAYSPYIENMDSPVYPVITTSNLTCAEQEQETNFQMGKVNVVDFPNSVVLPLQPVVDGNDSVDSILADVAITMEHLISKVTLNSQSRVSCDDKNLKLFNDSLSILKLEPGVKEVNDVNEINEVINEVINNITC